MIRARVTVANLAGAVLVAVEAVLVGVPASEVDRAQSYGLVTLFVAVVYTSAVIALELALANRRSRRTFGWVEERRAPNADEIESTFEFPWVQARWVFIYWLGAAVVFLSLNLA